MKKKDRHDKIKQLIKENVINTQEELVSLLARDGYIVTQATVSRDIRELQLTKIPNGDSSKYALLEAGSHLLSNKYLRVLQDGFLSIAVAQNLIVVKTVPGMAMAVAAALDSMQFKEVVGSIAGDDTIIAVLGTCEEASEVAKTIQDVAEE